MELLLDGGGVRSGDGCFFSAVRTFERAATAVALCDPWPDADDLAVDVLEREDGLNAEDKAAKAEALCVGPP